MKPSQYILIYGQSHNIKDLERVITEYVQCNLPNITLLKSAGGNDYELLAKINEYELEVNIATAALESWRKESNNE